MSSSRYSPAEIHEAWENVGKQRWDDRTHGQGIGLLIVDALTTQGTLILGRSKSPVRILAFNTVEGWSRDLTEEIAVALHERCADAGAVPQSLQHFLEQHGQ